MTPSEPSVPAALTLDRPLRFRRVCLEKVWGGRALEEHPGIALDVAGPVGETWELVDRDEQNSVVAEGPLAGRTLRELMQEAGPELLGATRPAAGGRFPLLVKHLSSTRPLSVQVHPDDATARKLGAGETGKDECWYILAAGPRSVVYLGLKPEVDCARFAAAATDARVVDLLQPFRVEPGQFVYVPAGTLHAIGEDVTLVEVQQNSDITYRLYDWGRVGLDGRPRETHLDRGLLAVRYDEPVGGPFTPELEERDAGNRGADLADGPYFGVELLHLTRPHQVPAAGRALVYVCVGGAGWLEVAAETEPCALRPGDTWLVPARVGAHRLDPGAGELQVLCVETRG